MKDVHIFQKVQTGDYVVPIEEACVRGGEYSEAFPTGFEVFDEAMRVDEPYGGVRDGDLIVITGKPGEGKTTFAQNIVMNFYKNSFPSLFFSYEVIPDNVYKKFKGMGYEDGSGLIHAPKCIITGNLKWVKEKIIEAKEKYMIKHVFIDHIDFLSASDANNSDQLRTRLKNITQELKTIALQEEVIIFLIAHSKKVEGREIEMQDIAESAGIYQLADFVFAVARAKDELPDGTTIFLDSGKVRMLKNRLTGKLPFLKFFIQNNIIKACHDQR